MEVTPEDMGRTTIQVSEELADELYERKQRGESYEDVIWRLITESQESGDSTGRAAGSSNREPRGSDAETTDEPDDRREPTQEFDISAKTEVEAWAADTVDDVAVGWADDDRLENRKAAARDVLIHAVDADAVGKSSEIVDELRNRHPVDGQDRETYWRKNLRPVLKDAGEYSTARHGYVVNWP